MKTPDLLQLQSSIQSAFYIKCKIIFYYILLLLISSSHSPFCTSTVQPSFLTCLLFFFHSSPPPPLFPSPRWMAWACRAAASSGPWRCWGGRVPWSDWGCWGRPCAWVTSCPRSLRCSPSDTPTASTRVTRTEWASTRFKRQVLRGWETSNILSHPAETARWNRPGFVIKCLFTVAEAVISARFVWADDELLWHLAASVSAEFALTALRLDGGFECVCLPVSHKYVSHLSGISSLREISRRAAYANRRPRHDCSNGKFVFTCFPSAKTALIAVRLRRVRKHWLAEIQIWWGAERQACAP